MRRRVLTLSLLAGLSLAATGGVPAYATCDVCPDVLICESTLHPCDCYYVEVTVPPTGTEYVLVCPPLG